MAESRSTEPRIGEFIRAHRNEILKQWEALVREMPQAARLSHARLVDHLPNLLESIASLVEQAGEAREIPQEIGPVPELHALQRLDIGFDLESVAAEYGLLRRCILEQFNRTGEEQLRLAEIQKLDEAVDSSISSAVVHYAKTREKVLVALDRISEATQATDGSEDFLPVLLDALVESSESVDAAMILLLEEDRLVVRASVGFAETPRATLAFGEGFAGRIASERHEHESLEGSSDERVKLLSVRARGLHALYGAPLVERDEVLGVALVGSLSTPGFSREDKLLFRTMASRASSLIVQGNLRQREREERLRAEASLALVRRDLMDREHMIGILAHDLRAPLQGIALSAQRLMKPEAFDPAVVRIAERMEIAADRMGRMIRDLLDFTRIRSGRSLPIARRPTDLRRLWERVEGLFEVTHPGRRIAFRTRGDCRGAWDPDRLSQVLTNLVGNALQYSPSQSPITVAVRGRGPAVLLAVSNQGPPMDPEIRRTIFEPFRRGAQEVTSDSLGLGLFIVEQIVRAHGGTVRLHSPPTAGRTTFTVCLPRAPSAVRETGSAAQEPRLDARA